MASNSGREDLFKVIAAIALVGVLLLAFKFTSLPSTPQEVKVNWDVGASEVTSQPGDNAVTEITAYQNPGQNRYYSDSGFGLVREARKIALNGGLNALAFQDIAPKLDSTSVVVNDLTDRQASVLETNYDYDLASEDSLLQKFVGRQITVLAQNQTVSGVLLNSGNGVIILQTPEGVASIKNYDRVVFPHAANLVSIPTLNVLLNAKNPGLHNIQVSYLTNGISWNAGYTVIANDAENSVDFQSFVLLKNEAGKNFDNAKLRLVAGSVNLVQPAPQPIPMYAKSGGAMGVPAVAENSQFTQSTLSEYYAFDLQRPVSVANNELKQIALYPEKTVGVDKTYVFQPSLNSKVQSKLEFENSEAKGLGVPLPAGVVRIYKPSASGQLEFLGEDAIDYTAKDEKVRLSVGSVFDLTGEKTEVNRQSIGQCSYRISEHVEIRSAKTQAATVSYVDDSLYGSWSVLKESQPHTKENAHTAKWALNVPPGGKADLDYEVLADYC